MAEYIDRNTAIAKVTALEVIEPLSTMVDVKRLLADIPAADVAPVRHGQWEKQRGLYSCSECGTTCPYDVQADVIEYWTCNYCPNCGAKMDLKDEEDNNANKKID